MKTLKIRIESLDEVEAAITEAVRSGRGETEAGLSFTSYDDMHRILSPRRLEIVRALAGRGAISMREVARPLDGGGVSSRNPLAELFGRAVIGSGFRLDIPQNRSMVKGLWTFSLGPAF
jgi:hypothetical protein